jgi:hypothetical protein
MIALITSKKSPRVTSVIGKVSNIRIGFTMAFKIANTMASTMAVQKVSMCTPLKIYDKPKATIEVTMIRMIKFITIFWGKLQINDVCHTSLA